MQRPAKPFTPVRFRLQPPVNKKYMNKYVIVSGGFDPVHSGHIQLINKASKYGKVIVIINNDNFLKEKKGYFFMSCDERIKVIKNIKKVSKVFLSIDQDHTVIKSIDYLVNKKKLNIEFFANGGDRKNESDIPENEVCKKNNIKLIFDIGGEKIQSSSSIVETVFDKISLRNNDKNIIQKPWGYYKNLLNENDFLLKKLVINPKEELSLQSHKYRDEHWTVAFGEISMILDKSEKTLKIKESIMIPKGAIHKIINNTNEIAIIIEVQYGHILNENDINRIEDKYDR